MAKVTNSESFGFSWPLLAKVTNSESFCVSWLILAKVNNSESLFCLVFWPRLPTVKVLVILAMVTFAVNTNDKSYACD